MPRMIGRRRESRRTILSLETLETRALLSVTRMVDLDGVATLYASPADAMRSLPNGPPQPAPPVDRGPPVVVTMPAEPPLPDGVFERADGLVLHSTTTATSVVAAAGAPQLDLGEPQVASMSGPTIVINAGPTLAANQPAMDAFQRAADQWAAVFTDSIVVTIDADLVNLGGGGIIGQASSVILQASYNTIRNQMIASADSDDGILDWLPNAGQFSATLPPGFGLTGLLTGTKASLKAMGFADLDGQFGASDATIQFNTQFPFDFDNSNGVTPGTMDFETVAAHEIGHALGFVSIVDTVDAYVNAGLTTTVSPRTLDLFRFANNVAGQDPATNMQFRNYPRFLTPGGDAIFDDLDNEWRLSTGSFTGDGRQASHWKDDNLTGELIGILDPTLAFGQTMAISYADIRALDVIGWDHVASANLPPVLDPIGNQVVDEGSLLSFTVTASDPNPGDVLTFSLEPGAPAGASVHPTSGLFTWTPDDSFAVPQSVTIIVTDNGTPSLSDSETIQITVNNVPPTAAVSGASEGVRGQPLAFTLTAADPSPVDQAAGFTFDIDWNGDGIVDETVIGPSGTVVEHVFPTTGVFDVRVTATDKDGGTSDVTTHPIQISRFLVTADDVNPALSNLVVGGSAGIDYYVFLPASGSSIVFFRSFENSVPISSFEIIPGVTGRIITYAQGSFSNVIVGELLTNTPVEFHGSNGNDVLVGSRTGDTLIGGGGNDVLIGGTATTDGGDLLIGSSGRNLLIGHRGANTLMGGSGDDLMMAGIHNFPNLPADIFAIQSIWVSAQPYETRVANLLPIIQPGTRLLNNNAVDEIHGGGGRNWFLLSEAEDIVHDLDLDEIVTDIG